MGGEEGEARWEEMKQRPWLWSRRRLWRERVNACFCGWFLEISERERDSPTTIFSYYSAEFEVVFREFLKIIFLNYFDVLILKINFKNKKIYIF